QWLQILAQKRNLANALRRYLVLTPSVNSLKFLDNEYEKKTTSSKKLKLNIDIPSKLIVTIVNESHVRALGQITKARI
ncbi:2183_t:CDS:2, partial [Funneliformis mosseae]